MAEHYQLNHYFSVTWLRANAGIIMQGEDGEKDKWRKTVGVEPTGERLTPSTGFEARPHHRMSVLSAVPELST
jgi:hypothetical protein